jgi:aminoglycoside phosphotransferase (APT) family kinase protein
VSDPNETFSGTRPVSEAHAIDSQALHVWLSQNVKGYQGPLTVEMFKGGQSNPTYKLNTPQGSYVMRAKPGPVAKLLPSAHAIEREFKVMAALSGSEVPVAQMLALCEDESVIGRAFYIMAFVPGRVLWEQSLPGMSVEQRRAHYIELNRVLCCLHRAPYASLGLSDYGRPGNYIERQISRWSKQYQASITQPIEAMDRLIEWLPRHMPASAKTDLTSIVHGDYRIDNVIYHPTEARILAVLDWELSTLGHPLADFSYHCMAWHIHPGTFRGIGGLDLVTLGIPLEEEYIRMYCDQTDFARPGDLQADWNFYLAYNMFRIAAILQGIAKRVEDGTASSAQAKASGAGARPMAELAWQYAQRA